MYNDWTSLQEDVGLYVVDGVLEEIRLGMEVQFRMINNYFTSSRWI